VLHVDKEVEVLQEISTKDGLFYICHDENPAKSAPKSQVKGEGTGTVSRNGRAIYCLQGQTFIETFTLSTRGWQNTHLCTCVHQKAKAAGAICNVKKAT